MTDSALVSWEKV